MYNAKNVKIQGTAAFTKTNPFSIIRNLHLVENLFVIVIPFAFLENASETFAHII